VSGANPENLVPQIIYLDKEIAVMSHFENVELGKSAEPSMSDLASQALLADSMPPFKVAFKQEEKPIVLATNDHRSGCSTCSTTDVPPVDSAPSSNTNENTNHIDFKPQMSQEQLQKQGQEQGQQQSAEAIAKAQAAAAASNENHIANTGTVNGTVNSSLEGKQSTVVGNTSSLANQIEAGSAVQNAGNSANNINVGGNTYKSFSNARGEALPGNECQTFAFRADGHFMGTGGGIGFSDSDNACIEAKAVKVNCDATETMGKANQYNSAAEQSWLKVASPAQQEELIKHGIGNASKISDNVVKKSAECAGAENKEAPPPSVERRETRQVENQGNLVTKEELRQMELKQDSKLNAAFRHTMQK